MDSSIQQRRTGLLRATPGLVGKLALVTAGVTAGLIAYGAWVRATGSGLGCPDWPLCNDAVVPTNRAAAIESGHRWFAAVTLLLVFASAGLGLGHRREFPRASGALLAAGGLIVAQAVLGAVVVLTELQSMAVLAHLAMAMGVVALMTVAGISLARGRDASFALQRPGWHLAFAAAAVIMLGGAIIATHTSFECPALPVCDASSPAMASVLHGAHRTLATVVFLAAVLFAFRLWRRCETGPLFKATVGVSMLLAGQIAVGVSAVALDLPAGLRVLHLGVAALIWWGMVAMWTLSEPRARNGQENQARSTC